MTTATATKEASFSKLSEINHALSNLKLRPLTVAEARAIHAQGLRNTIVTLIQRSIQNDEGALAALTAQVSNLERAAGHEQQAPKAPHGDPQVRQAQTQAQQAPAPQVTPQRREAVAVDAQPPPTTAIQTREYASEHVYGQKAALCFEAGTSRVSEANPNRGGNPTIFLQGAKSVGDRRFDWGNKITLQFTPAELVAALAVFYGYVEEIKFSNHGPANDKGFQISNQADRGVLFVRVSGGGQGNFVAVPIPAADAARVAALILRQSCEHYGLSDSAMLNTVVRVYARLAPK